MAEYLPPTETLPVFNEFVFEDAYSIEGLDRRVVHKAGTETITGNKTFTGVETFKNDSFNVKNTDGVDRINTTATATNITNVDITLLTTSGTNKLESQIASGTANLILANGGGNNIIQTTAVSATSNNILRTITGSNIMEITNVGNAGGQNTIQSALGQATPFGVYTAVNKIISLGTLASNEFTSALGTNKLTSGLASATANVIEATAVGGGNKMTTTSGENLLTTSTGINRMTSPNVAVGYWNILEATAGLGSNKITAVGGDNYISTHTGNNYFSNLTGTNKIQNTGGANLITALTTGTNTIQSVTGQNKIENTGGTNLITALTTGTNTIQSVSGKNLLTSSTGDIELITGSLSAQGINIENTNTTTGGIRLKTAGTTGGIQLETSNSGSSGLKLSNVGTGGIQILSSTATALQLGTGTTNYATISSSGVGAVEYWVGSGGAATFPMTFPLNWFSTQTAGQTTSQCRVGSFANNDTGETFLRYRLPYRSRIRAITLLSDGETINANQTYIHISITNTTGLDTSPAYGYWIYNAGVANPGDIVVTDNGNMISVADIPANSTFYVFLAYGSTGIIINSVGTARTVPGEFQVHLYLQQVI
jgi:hypothetical protein